MKSQGGEELPKIHNLGTLPPPRVSQGQKAKRSLLLLNKVSNSMLQRRTIPAAAALLLASCIYGTHSFTLNGSRRTATTTITLSRRSHHQTYTSFGVDIFRLQQQRCSTTLLLSAAVKGETASSSDSSNVDYPPASDGEALQSLFSKHCNGGGLMTEEELRSVPAIKEMMVRYCFVL